MATAWTPPPARRGFPVGNRLCPALRGGLSCPRRLSRRLCIVDGERPLALRRSDRKLALPANARQYLALCRPRRECEDVSGLAAVRLLSAPTLVDQGIAGRLCVALGARGDPSLHLAPLDADRRAGFGRRPVVGAVRH